MDFSFLDACDSRAGMRPGYPALLRINPRHVAEQSQQQRSGGVPDVVVLAFMILGAWLLILGLAESNDRM